MLSITRKRAKHIKILVIPLVTLITQIQNNQATIHVFEHNNNPQVPIDLSYKEHYF